MVQGIFQTDVYSLFAILRQANRKTSHTRLLNPRKIATKPSPKSTNKMAFTAPSLLSIPLPSESLKSPKYSSFTIPPPATAIRKRFHLFSSSGRDPISDAELASELSTEFSKIHAPLMQRKEAMEKSKDLLFGDFCRHLGLKEEEVRKSWREAGEEERLDLVRGFVSDWGVGFHPLSLKSVKEMVEECIGEENPPPISCSPFVGLDRLKKVMRLS